MPKVRVVGEGGQVNVVNIISRSVSIERDNEETLEPAVAQRVEYDHRGQSTSVTTECGETENRRTSDQKPDITVEGVLTEEQLPEAKRLKEGDEVILVSDVHQGLVYVKRLTIEQNTDIIEFVEDGDSQLAFTFQLQLKQPE